MALTPAEEKELADLEAMSQQAPTSNGLTPEEEIELAQLEGADPRPDIMAHPEAPSLEKVAAGTANLIEGASLGGFSDISAVGNTAMDFFTGDIGSISELGNKFKQHQTDAESALKYAKDKYPDIAFKADMAGTLMTGIAGQASKRAANAAIGAGMAGVQAAQDDQEIGDIFKQAFLGGVVSVAPAYASDASQWVATKIARSSAFDAIGALATSAIKNVKKSLFVKGISDADTFTEDVRTAVTLEGKPLVSPRKSLEDMASDAKDLTIFHGEEMGNILRTADNYLQGTPIIDGSKIADVMRSRIASARDLAPTVPADIAAIASLKQFAAETFDGKVYNLVDLHRVKTSISTSLSDNAFNKIVKKDDKIFKDLVGDIDNAIQDGLGKAGVDQNLQGAYNEAKRKFATMGVIADSAREEASKAGYGFLTGVKENFIRNAGISLLGSSQISERTGLSTSNSVLVGMGLLAAARNPRLNAAVVRGMGTVANALQKNPERYAALASKISVGANLGTQEWINEIGHAEAELELDASPIARSTMDVIAKKQFLFSKMDELGMDSEPLKEAINKSDSNEIGRIIGELAQLPSMKSYIQPGVGFNGRVFSPEDIATVKAGIDSNKALTPRQKRQMTTELMDSGVIPTMQPQAAPAPTTTKDRILNAVKSNKPKQENY